MLISLRVFTNTKTEMDDRLQDSINRLWFVLPEQLGLDSESMDDSIYFSAQRGTVLLKCDWN